MPLSHKWFIWELGNSNTSRIDDTESYLTCSVRSIDGVVAHHSQDEDSLSFLQWCYRYLFSYFFHIVSKSRPVTFNHPSYKYTGFGKILNEFQQTHSFRTNCEVSQSLVTAWVMASGSSQHRTVCNRAVADDPSRRSLSPRSSNEGFKLQSQETLIQ